MNTFRPGTNYNYRMRMASAGPLMIPADTARALIAVRCADGQHRQEIDPETGNEVCRFCETVIDDYADVAEVDQLAAQEVRDE